MSLTRSEAQHLKDYGISLEEAQDNIIDEAMIEVEEEMKRDSSNIEVFFFLPTFFVFPFQFPIPKQPTHHPPSSPSPFFPLLPPLPQDGFEWDRVLTEQRLAQAQKTEKLYEKHLDKSWGSRFPGTLLDAYKDHAERDDVLINRKRLKKKVSFFFSFFFSSFLFFFLTVFL